MAEERRLLTTRSAEPRLPRRVVLGAGAAAAGVVAGAAGWVLAQGAGGSSGQRRIHQVGVVSAPRAVGRFVACDVRGRGSASVRSVLRALSRAIVALPTGVEVTVAVGASLFDHRFGLAKRRPRRLRAMTAFANDALQSQWCHGDVLLQVCASSKAEVAQAVERLTAVDGLAVRWAMDGFRAENTTTANGRPSTRDLFGFREGVGNPDSGSAAEMGSRVWAGPDDGEPVWAAGGTYMVVRLIRFAMRVWDAEPLSRQEAVIGRRKSDGAPLGRHTETAAFDYRSDPSGRVVPLDAHIRRANPRTAKTDGSRILRRGYSYRSEPDGQGRADEGLVFVCFQQDLDRGFVTVQRRLDGEALSRYILPFGGGYYYVPPGVDHTAHGDYLGRGLLEAESPSVGLPTRSDTPARLDRTWVVSAITVGTRVGIERVVQTSGVAGVCVVRCLAGPVSVGDLFDTAILMDATQVPVRLRIRRMWRYGRVVDLLDPPHGATLELTGSKVESLITVRELRGALPGE